MRKVLHKKSDDVHLSFHIDSDFAGILLGFAHDESEGCVLKGELIMEVIHRTTIIKGLMTVFSGICQVSLKDTHHTLVGVPLHENIENHIVIRKTVSHFDEYTITTHPENSTVKSTTFEPGTYKYPFSFTIPPVIPQSFKGKYGSIEYELSATAILGTLFSSSVHIAQPIVLRRCLMNELDPAATATQTVHGTTLGNIVTYSATAPSMVYSEGGLLKLDLHVELKDPSRYSVRMVTCGLQEKVFYRTTRGKNNQHASSIHYNDFSFPLGCSTFFPSKHPDYNPADLHNYNAIFRLYPRVCTDNRASLIVVQHALLIRMVIDDNKAVEMTGRRRSSIDSVRSLSPKAILSHFSSKQYYPDDAATIPISPEEHEDVEFTLTPPLSRSPSISESLNTATGSTDDNDYTSSSSIIALDQLHSFQSGIVRVSSRKASPNTTAEQASHLDDEGHHIGHSLVMHHHFNPLKFYNSSRDSLSAGSYECKLSVPIIVTSRQEYREGSVPALPDYETTVDEPPSYLASLQSLPPVPIYPSSDDSDSTMSRAISRATESS